MYSSTFTLKCLHNFSLSYQWQSKAKGSQWPPKDISIYLFSLDTFKSSEAKKKKMPSNFFTHLYTRGVNY